MMTLNMWFKLVFISSICSFILIILFTKRALCSSGTTNPNTDDTSQLVTPKSIVTPDEQENMVTLSANESSIQ